MTITCWILWIPMPGTLDGGEGSGLKVTDGAPEVHDASVKVAATSHRTGRDRAWCLLALAVVTPPSL